MHDAKRAQIHFFLDEPLFYASDIDLRHGRELAQVPISAVDLLILETLRASNDGEISAAAFDGIFDGLRYWMRPDESGAPGAEHFAALRAGGLTEGTGRAGRPDESERVTGLGRAVLLIKLGEATTRERAALDALRTHHAPQAMMARVLRCVFRVGV